MILCDVNVFLHALIPSSAHHAVCRKALEEAARSNATLGVNSAIFAGVVRIGSNPKIFSPQCRTDDLFSALDDIIMRFTSTRSVEAGPRHSGLFRSFVLGLGITGAGVTDAWFAALAVENDAEWWSCDQGFSRFPGLKWKNLL